MNIKRGVDILASATIIILLFPLLLLLYFLVKMYHGSPVLFSQNRPGLRSEMFRLYKFRSMNDKRDNSGELLPDSERLTKFGKILRSTSLDELPSLWNVLKGDMSFVGPRPLLEEYLPLYTPRQSRRHSVRPGITGWAQVNGRNSISWEEKFELDIWYIENHSLLLDLKIILLTIGKVFSRSDISHEGSATMPPFKGKCTDNGQ